ncbi:hypothetical protein ATCC90586_009693 [Pythium insidiosum]|nr:hypothetical protein ATCC90586_009693 [Pythium insidiosum]
MIHAADVDASLADAVPAPAPADDGFRWDGTSSDLARQFFRLSRNATRARAAATLPFTHEDLPSAVQQRIDAVGLRFENLPALLQRAVVWDSGYVQGNGRELLRVYTAGGRSMAELAISLETFRAAGCAARNCSGGVYRSQFCSGAQITSVTRCATEDVVNREAHLSLWATGGDDAMVPELNLMRHWWVDADKTYLVYAIHTIAEERQPSWGKCPDASTQQASALVIPCAPYRTVKNKDAWQPPAHGPLVDSWLQQAKRDAAAQATPSPSGSSGGSSFDPIYLIPAIVGIILVVGSCTWYYVRRRRHRYSASARPSSRRVAKQRQLHDDLNDDDDDDDDAHGSFRSTATPTPLPSTSGGRASDVYDNPNNNTVSRMLLTDPHLVGTRVAFDRLVMKRLVSKGAFGEVWVATYADDSGAEQTVAVKRLLQDRANKFHDLEAFSEEIRLTASFSHPNVLRFLGVAWSRLQNLCMITEYMPNGDLQGFLHSNRDALASRWTLQKVDVALGVARALTYLHQQDPVVIHRDIKARNVLLADDWSPRLIDFGVSRRRIDHTMTAGVGTPYWTAPEILEGVRYSEKGDVYSFGVLLVELETCQLPFHDRTRPPQGNGSAPAPDRCSEGDCASPSTPEANAAAEGTILRPFQILKLVMNGTLRPAFSPDCPQWLRDVAAACFHNEAAKRPSAAELVATLETQRRRMHDGEM